MNGSAYEGKIIINVQDGGRSRTHHSNDRPVPPKSNNAAINVPTYIYEHPLVFLSHAREDGVIFPPAKMSKYQLKTVPLPEKYPGIFFVNLGDTLLTAYALGIGFVFSLMH